jgi:hypothetical protein
MMTGGCANGRVKIQEQVTVMLVLRVSAAPSPLTLLARMIDAGWMTLERA